MKKSLLLFFVSCLIADTQKGWAQNELWGMTHAGGADFIGTIFKTNADGTSLSVQRSFTATFSGARPEHSQLTEAPNGKLYGMTTQGGSNDMGVLFEYDPATNSYVRKLSFDGLINGAYPVASLVLFTNGKLYGTTSGGGANSVGILFEYDPGTNTFINKFDFVTANGASPRSDLTIAEGKLYGATYEGGANSAGVLFEYDPATNTHTKKVDFNGTSGAFPYGSLLRASNGKLYGMTSAGGATGVGVLFEYDPITNTYNKELDFAGAANGANPKGGLTENINTNTLFGMTHGGGVSDKGVLFEYDPTSNTYTKKIDFNGTNGANPDGSLTLFSGKFYGVTVIGGSNNIGVLFEYDPVALTYTRKRNFNLGGSGNRPVGSLMQSSNGKLYGMTSYGGSNDQGVIFEYIPSTGAYSRKIDFNLAPTGSLPTGSLTQFPNGRLYGMTPNGGASSLGVLFEFNPGTNSYTKKVDFAGTTNGAKPNGSLTLAANSKLYGMTYRGGANDAGVLFEYDPITNTYSKKIDFSLSIGAYPYGDLIKGSNGKLYGMTSQGGAASMGALFEYDPLTNSYTKKHDFDGALTGAFPKGSLVEASNGKLYGMTDTGGANDKGVLFEYDLSTNSYSKKLDFDGTPTGANPFSGLTQFSNGKLYGMTLNGGATDEGVLFEYDPSTGNYTNRLNFSSASTGAFPYGNLIQSSNGKLYGMTSYGAVNNFGAMFEFDPALNSFTKKTDFAGSNGAYSQSSLTFFKTPQTNTFNPLPAKTYGDADFNLTATASSSLPITYTSSDLTIATIMGNTVTILKAGIVTITASQMGDVTFFQALDVSQTLTINKATLTTTTADKSRIYGDANPVFSIGYSGFKGADDLSMIDQLPSVSTAATLTSDAGIYPITISGGTDNNYVFAFTPGTLTVNKATLTATAEDKAKIYGDANPVFSIVYSGFKLTDDASVINTPPATSSTATTTSDVGTYPIALSGGTDNNYSFGTLTSGSLTVNKAMLIATADDKSKIYGDANPVFTINYTGLKGTDNASVIDTPPTTSSTATTTSDVATYPITIAGGTDNNYSFGTLTAGTLTVNKATLTATAEDKSKIYGDTNPMLTINYSGFKGTDNATVIDTPPSLSTGATTTSNVGMYPITIASGSDNNYSFSVTAGTLTINKAGQTISFPPLAIKTLGDPAFSLTATASSSLPISYSTTSDKVTILGVQVTIVKSGRAVITASQAGGVNYMAASVDQSFCINPAKPVVSVANATSASPTLTSSASTGNQWFLNGAAISGATDATYTTTQSGLYKVQVKVDDCASEFSTETNLMVTGVESTSNISVGVYPNPAFDWLVISLGDGPEKKGVSIYQLDGKKTDSQEVTGNEATFYVAGYSQGMYLIKVKTENTVQVLRFVKE